MNHTMQLVIVRRNQFAAFGLLSQAFADEADVRLIWDRRAQDRRRQTVSQVGERRGRDRRRDGSASWGDRDYIVISQKADSVPIHLQNQAITSAHAQTAVRLAGYDVRQDLEAAVRSDINVLITGGDPVSRESLARRIHRRSDRHDGPFLAVDCRAADELFGESALEPCLCPEREADQRGACPKHAALGGTVLIQEVADLSWEQQTDLLSYLERRAVRMDGTKTDVSGDARVIAASNYWLFDRIASKQFRPDLFYRLNLIHVVFPLGTVRSREP
jgi:DNA-binding NtrC family response regulator